MGGTMDNATGGCMCGAVRYEATGEPFLVSHCHCLSCRRHTGAPVVTLLGYTADQLRFTGDERRIYESSPGVGRAFCGKCGTPLTWEGNDDELGPLFEIHISTLDAPDAFVPTSHGFHPERIAWFDIADNLPRHAGFAGDSETIGQGPVGDGLPG